MQGRGILISILLISLFAIYANAYQTLPTVNMCPGPVYKTVYQPLRGVEGDVTDWVSQAALPENPGGVCDPTIVTATNEPPAGPCPYRGDCPHATIPTTGQFTRHDLDIVSFWGFNDANYLNFALQVYFFNATNLCPVGQTIYPERNVCYIAGINELAQESPAYYRACINSTGAGTVFTGTNGVCPTNFPVDYQFWWGPIFNQGQTRNRAFIFKCSDVNRTGDPSFQSFQTFVCNVPMDFSTINTLILVNGAVNPAIADFVYELSTSDFGVLQYDPNLFGSYLEVRLPLSVFGVTGPEYIGRRIYFHWQTGMVAPGYIQKHCPQADTPWYIPLLCDLNPTGLNITTGIPITYFPELSCNETYFFAPNITVDNRAHDPWPGEPPASPITTRTFCNPSESLFNCSYLGNNTLIAGTQLCCDPLASPSCQVNDPSCLTPDKDILGAWMITDGDWLYIRIDAPIGYNFTINNNAYISICFDVPGSRSGNSVSGDCGAGTLREVDYVLYYTQGRSASGPDCGGPLFCSLPGATFKNCSLNCNNDPSCCKADWGLPGYAPYVNNLKWCSNPANCFPSSIIELGIPLSSLGFNGSTGAVFNYSIRLSNQGLTPNVQYPQGGGAQIILPCRVPVPQTTGTTGIPLVNIGTYVWFDTNYNGQRDEAGTGVPGVQVTLTDCSGTVLGTTTTNANGQYLFTGVPSGTSYQVFFNPANLPAGTVFTKGNLGSDTTDSDVIDINTGAVECFFIPFGQNHLDADAGIYRPRCIGQFVWYDTNINGLQDAGEPGVSGIPVTLTGSNGSVVAQTVTNSTGGYLFCGLYPDNYTVTFQINGSMIYTPVYRAGNGANPDRDSDVNPAFVVGGTGIVQVPLPPSTDSLHNDAGVVSYGCLGDRVWYDTNLNGQRDVGEVGVGGITVYLLNGTTVIGTTTTNGTGYYLFCQLIPTNTGYSVTFVLPNPTYSFTLCRANGVPTDINSDACTISGLNGSTPLIPVPPGQTVLHNDAGIFGLGCIGQYVWYDTNLNGLQDAGEAGVSGIPVTLRFQNGSIAATQATNGTGYYLFCNLRPSNYTVQFQINPALFAFTPVFRAGNGANADFDSDINPFAVVNGLGTTPPIDLQPGTNSLHNDAGIISFGCIGDRVWYDYHVNGRQEADEGGVPGVTVYLLNGTTVVATTTTNATGYYLFCSLFPTTIGYRVTFVLPPNYVFTTCQVAGVPASQDSDACTISGRNGTTGLIPLLAGQVNLDIDAGMYNLSCVGDFVWLDSNTNGIQNGEAGIGGITVVLSYCNGTVINSTVTNGNGGYSFCGLYPNNYQLQFNFNTSFYTCSPPLQGADRCVDSDITNCNTRTTTCFSLDTGVNDTCRDTGLYPFGRIGDFVWNDLNANGIQNAGEPGLAGLRVDLLNGTSLVQINQTTTDAQGIYSFAFLNPGQYRVRFYCPAGFVWTSYHIGSANLDSDANFALPNSTSATSPIITLPTGGVDLTWDAGCYQLSSIGDFIWNDLNANGQQDSGEPGVSINVTLNFVNASGTFPMRSQISNSNGFYLFDNLYPNSIIGGQYQVVFLINPIFYKFTTPFVGNTATDSNAVQQTPQIGLSNLITLPAAFNELTIDAGLIRLAQTTGTTGTTGINIYCFSCPFGNYISSFNFVSLGNLTMISSDIEGRAAAGGSAWLDNTGIGASVSSSSSCIPVKNPALASIVVQRRLQKNGGGSWGGNIYYGLASSVITAQSMDSGCFAVLNATAFNWTQIADYLLTLSDRLNTGADFLATGFPYYYPGPKSVYLNGQAPSSTNREIFRVHWPSVPTGGSVAWDLSVPNTVDTIIINVNGTNINFTSSMSNNMDAYKNRIIWNFWQATKITLNGAFKGALLAPLADVNGVDGLLEGQVFVKSWVGKMEIHYVKFIGCIPFISLAAGADPTCVSV